MIDRGVPRPRPDLPLADTTETYGG